jgi:tRNA G37 N-methylase TrmD
MHTAQTFVLSFSVDETLFLMRALVAGIGMTQRAVKVQVVHSEIQGKQRYTLELDHEESVGQRNFYSIGKEGMVMKSDPIVSFIVGFI